MLNTQTRLIACSLLLFAAPGCRSSRGAEEKAIPTPVKVRIVAEASALEAQRYSGSVEPATRVDIAFKVGGHVRALAERPGPDGRRHAIQEGDRVEKGAVLAVVKESDYQVRFESAVSSLAEAKASVRQAELDHQRSAKLLASHSVSQAETDSMSVKLDVARARLAGALSKVQEARLALEDCIVRAPIGGVVLKRSVEIGTLVGQGSPAFVLADTSNVKVVFGAPDKMVEKLSMGGQLEVEVPAISARFKATITRISPAADRSSRVFDIETTIGNPKDQLRVGMIASLSIPKKELETTSLALPLTAVLRSKTEPRGFSVFVLEGDGERGVAKSRDVSLGEVLGNQVLVRGGLARGERVISMGATELFDGAQVRVIPTKEN
jgi:RND family efflux transporter MFP subunit